MAVEIKSTVEDFWLARGRGEYFPAASEGRLSLDEAYRIQLALIDRRVAAGERLRPLSDKRVPKLTPVLAKKILFARNPHL